MTKVEALEREVQKLTEDELAAFRDWFAEYAWQARHEPDEVTGAINRAVDEIGDQTDEFVATAARRVLEKTEW